MMNNKRTYKFFVWLLILSLYISSTGFVTYKMVCACLGSTEVVTLTEKECCSHEEIITEPANGSCCMPEPEPLPESCCTSSGHSSPDKKCGTEETVLNKNNVDINLSVSTVELLSPVKYVNVVTTDDETEKKELTYLELIHDNPFTYYKPAGKEFLKFCAHFKILTSSPNLV